MTTTSRRTFLGAAAGIGAATTVSAGASPARAAPSTRAAVVPVGDARYEWLVSRGYNKRFTAHPEAVHVVHSAAEVVTVLEAAVRDGKRVMVRGGGHCFDGLVDDPQAQVLIDVSEMNDVSYDPRRRAVAVQAGATLGQVFRSMFLNWGVTIPAGVCPDVGIAGHTAGGGYGPLSRVHGLVVDHLYAVEVVVVDASGRARKVVATRDDGDPDRELWWAHTGGGGGNFGVVTTYWFRSPGAEGDDPEHLLPKAPATVKQRHVKWAWNELSESDFIRLVRNYGEWNARYGSASTEYDGLYSGLTLYQRASSPQLTTSIELLVQIDAAGADADQLLDRHVAAVGAGMTAQPTIERTTLPWLSAALGYDPGPGARMKTKGEYLRRPWNERQLATVYRYLSAPAQAGLLVVTMYAYGARINTVAPGATATAQRDSVMKLWYAAFWPTPELDAANLTTIRSFYGDMHPTTGGVPALDADSDGCYINYADVDMADPAWNRSGLPWGRLYYKDNYPRLQQIKARWDPRNVFRHGLSIPPAGAPVPR